MVSIIFKNGMYNGINREMTIGEATVTLDDFPHYLEKRSDGKLITFNSDPFKFTLDEVMDYKRVMSTSDTFFYNSVRVAPTKDCPSITHLESVHLSTDGFIIEPGGSVELFIEMDESVNFTKLKLEGSYISELDIKSTIGDEIELLPTSNKEFMSKQVYDNIKFHIHNNTDRIIVLSECVFMY